MKNVGSIILLLIWSTAILAPYLLTVTDWGTDMVVDTIGEEDQKEKEDGTEEKIVHYNTLDFLLAAFSGNMDKSDDYTSDYSGYTLEILLPPPEHTT